MSTDYIPTKAQRVMAVASFGGHLVQLLRITRFLSDRAQVSYVTTSDQAVGMLPPKAEFVIVDDFSRWNPRIIPRSAKQMWRAISRFKPTIVVSTGAAPGLVALFVAYLRGKKTVWVDSMANTQRLSMSGRIARRFATLTLTQWEHLADGIDVMWAGNVFTNKSLL